VNFIDTTVLSMLTEFPVLCSTSILPLLANVIGATVVILVVYAVHKCVYLVEKIYFGDIVLSSDWLSPRNVKELYVNIPRLVMYFLESILFFLNVIGATVVILVVYAVHTCVYLVEKIYFGIIVLYSDWSFPRNVEELYINILDLVICFLESIIFFLPPPRTQLYNRSCSNKHTPEAEITILPPREQLCTRSCSNKTHT
jgi:uncharacterized membrane protein YeaQ/YmgE (transglycosylase-associated protein family)